MHMHLVGAASKAASPPMAPSRAPPRRASSATAAAAPAARRVGAGPGEDGAAEASALAEFARRGPECAFRNVRLLGRVVGAFYDEKLKPADLRASQLALLWSILACQPVEQKALERVTETDQTTLSRTVEHLRAGGLVKVTQGADRRVRMIMLSARGRRAFLRAMPYWEAAQREMSEWLALGDLRSMARSAHRFAQARRPADDPPRARRTG